MENITPIQKMRSVVAWADWQNETFNDRFKSAEDIIKAFDYCVNNDIEFLDDLSYLSNKEYNRVKKDLKTLLGYSVLS